MSIVIIGAGPNLGMAIARRFGREGLAVGLISRNQEKLDGLVAELTESGITAGAAAADIRDPAGLAAADEGMHAAHTAIHGGIGPGKDFEPDAVADLLWRHHTARQGFQTRLGIAGDA